MIIFHYPDGRLAFWSSTCGCCPPMRKHKGHHARMEHSHWVRLTYLNGKKPIHSTWQRVLNLNAARKLAEGCAFLREFELQNP